MKDIGIIGSADGPTSIYVSSNDENFWQSGGIVPEDEEANSVQEFDISENSQNELDNTIEEIVVDENINAILDSKTLGENLDAGVKIMGIGMVAVFGVLNILYLVVKIMGQFAKGKKDEEK